MKNKHMHTNNKNNLNKDRKEWSKEWALEKQTEGLDKRAVEKQEKIGHSLENEPRENKKHHEKKHNEKNEKNLKNKDRDCDSCTSKDCKTK